MKKLSLSRLFESITLLDFIKLLGLLGIGLVLSLAFKVHYSFLLTISFGSIVLFLALSFGYFILEADNEERKILIGIWKLYMTVITLMVILIYTIENNAHKIQLEYDKTKLLYDLKTNSNDINKSFMAYEKTVKKIQKRYQEEELNYINELDEKPNDLKEEKVYINFYMNFSSVVILIMTIFAFLWFMIERADIKKSQKVNSYLEKYKVIIAERKKLLRK